VIASFTLRQANFAWYLIAFAGDEDIERRMESAIEIFLKAYSAAFLVDGPEAELWDVLNDSLGFLGFWILFLEISCPVVILEVNRGDEAEKRRIHAMLVSMATAALTAFLDGRARGPLVSGGVGDQGQARVVRVLREGLRGRGAGGG
jgi:hypothetical protein